MLKQEQADKFLEKYEPKELKEADLASFSTAYQQLGKYITNLIDYDESCVFEREFTSYNFADKLWDSSLCAARLGLAAGLSLPKMVGASPFPLGKSCRLYRGTTL